MPSNVRDHRMPTPFARDNTPLVFCSVIMHRARREARAVDAAARHHGPRAGVTRAAVHPRRSAGRGRTFAHVPGAASRRPVIEPRGRSTRASLSVLARRCVSAASRSRSRRAPITSTIPARLGHRAARIATGIASSRADHEHSSLTWPRRTKPAGFLSSPFFGHRGDEQPASCARPHSSDLDDGGTSDRNGPSDRDASHAREKIAGKHWEKRICVKKY